MNSAAWTLAAFLLAALFLVSLSLIGRCRDAKKDRERAAMKRYMFRGEYITEQQYDELLS